MNAQPATLSEPEVGQLTAPLLDRMDSAIGEASSVMGAMMTELIRRSLRGGVLQIGQGLNDYVGERVDATIVEKAPAIEQMASETADRTARAAATEVAKEETEALARLTRESDQQLAAQIGSAQQATVEVARDLSTKIDQAEKRACETSRTEMDHRVDELMQKSRSTVAALKERLKALRAAAADLGKRLATEQDERKAGLTALHAEVEKKSAALARGLDEEKAARRDADTKQERELLRALQEASTRMHEEIGQLRNANFALEARVAELEKPRGLRALLQRLMFWRKR